MCAKVSEEPAAAPARARWREYGPITLVLAVAAVLLFTGLDRDYLWADEGDTAVLARSILKFGVPTAWDGVTFTDSDFGARLTDDFVMVSHPWLQYYVTAASFALFGETTIAARLPFALLGFATIALVYAMVLHVSRNRWTAVSAAVLLTLSVQFLIYARQSRHYTLNAALTCLLVFQFTRLRSWSTSLVFALLAILLFHSLPVAIAPILALGALSLVYAPFREQRRWFWRAMPVVAAFTLPWLFLAKSGYEQSTGLLQTPGVFFPRLAQFAIECASVTSIIGAAVLLVVAWRRARPAAAVARGGNRPVRRREVFAPDEREVMVALVGIMVAYTLMMALTQPSDAIWTVGVRYTPAVIPFMAIIIALVAAKASLGNWRVWLAIILVLGFTKVGTLTPWTFWQEPTARRDSSADVTFHYPKRFADRVFPTEQIAFVQSLFVPNPGTTGRVVEFLNGHAAPSDIVVTNYAWEPLYFHTRLPQGMTVLPFYSIYQAAREHRLPEYVFREDGARWIVWRRAWGPYRGQALDKVLARLKTENIPVTLVATIPETLWENRENVHFRRFPGNWYVYPWFGDLPETQIYRVDWPKPAPLGPGSSR